MNDDMLNQNKTDMNDPSGAATGTAKTYVTGFVLALVLTAIPFALVMQSRVPHTTLVLGIAATGILQALAHLYYFLHLDTSSRSLWNGLALIFAVLVMVLVVGGTVWIMHNLAYNLQ